MSIQFKPKVAAQVAGIDRLEGWDLVGHELLDHPTHPISKNTGGGLLVRNTTTGIYCLAVDAVLQSVPQDWAAMREASAS